MEQAIKIQQEQLERWRNKLTPKLFKDLYDNAVELNKKTTDPYNVFRGTDLDNFIHNWKE